MEQSLLTSPGSLGELWSPPCWSSLGQHWGQQKPLDWPPLHGVNLHDLQIHFKIKEVKLLASLGSV